ncbi:hypothetical protein ACFLXH_00935 [Chloroflexota bacterium]
MTDVVVLLERCRALGVTLIPLQGRLRVQAEHALPNDIIAELREAKPAILAELQSNRRKESECWLLEEWRRNSIPEWRRILQESIRSENAKREEYARWMLKEILQDAEYKEQK